MRKLISLSTIICIAALAGCNEQRRINFNEVGLKNFRWNGVADVERSYHLFAGYRIDTVCLHSADGRKAFITNGNVGLKAYLEVPVRPLGGPLPTTQQAGHTYKSPENRPLPDNESLDF